jgi:integrase
MEDSMRARQSRIRGEGSVVLDKRIKTSNFFFWEKGKRRSKKIGAVSQYPTKAAAWKAAKPLRDAVENQVIISNAAPTVSTLVEQYRAEKMPQRYSTRRGYEVYLRHRILPRWGTDSITDVQARPVELWLQSLTLAPKTKAEIRGLLRILWEFAMWRGDVATQRNPMELVTVRGASKRTRKPRSLTVEEFHRFITHLAEPFRTMALTCVCFGLRISECLALKWSDVDWLSGKLSVQRGIVKQRVDDVKTIGSERLMSIHAELMEVLTQWKATSQFSGNEDWMFASPAKLGRQPWSYDQVLRSFVKAGTGSGIGKLGTHSMRHTYRSWLDAVGTSLAVQQKLMRHADIRTTMNVYGDIVTDEMSVASGKVANLALNGR